jgi:putative pyruvate formate lyase activating enzyme
MPELPSNIAGLGEIVRDCTLCPRNCHVDRAGPKRGACRIGLTARIDSVGPHFGEEPVLVGRGGSGTIFLSACNLDCVFCQNSDISHSAAGQELTPKELADAAVRLERAGCENVNFVTPTHVSHAIAEAVWSARAMGLTVPVVYNCGGYESVETLRLLEGLVEIYMPDFKYAAAEAGRKYSGVPDYPTVADAALAEMFRQVGRLQLDRRDVAVRGVLVRHLVMPGNLAGSREVIARVARIAPGCAINVMGQYHPAHRAAEFDELMSRPSAAQVRQLRDFATSLGLVRVD